VPPGADAITLGSLVIIRRHCAGSEHLWRHELVHVEQWRRYGVAGFLVRYVGAYVAARLRWHSHHNAYLRIPLEVEAEWTATQRAASARAKRPWPGVPADG